ncbi:IS3 family transposase [Fibrella rubiginis]|uniref:IS3 family transposase n=1 Tax=Fibrella rubiginis TaxID=2817060 RepID=UPI00286E1885|nr:IS3 family transposase [Fibrella rubiginis]
MSRATRANRISFVSTDWTAKSRKRLPQKKITDELSADLRLLIDPTYTHLSVNQQCGLLGLARSTYYYQPVGESAQNLALMERIDKLFMARPELGVERMCQELTNSEQPVNVKRVRRLMRLMGLEAVGPKPNLSKPHPGHTIYPYLLRGVVIERPNQVWSTDITYVPMANGFLYLCAIIDWFSRFILSWRLSNTLLADFCVDALEESLSKWGKPEIFNTDQGSQFTSHDFLKPLIGNEIRISMDSKGRALDNIFIERFWRTIKHEHLYLTAYADGRSLHQGLGTYFQFYNQERKHQSLGYQTPAEWYERGKESGKVQLLPPLPASLI